MQKTMTLTTTMITVLMTCNLMTMTLITPMMTVLMTCDLMTMTLMAPMMTVLMTCDLMTMTLMTTVMMLVTLCYAVSLQHDTPESSDVKRSPSSSSSSGSSSSSSNDGRIITCRSLSFTERMHTLISERNNTICKHSNDYYYCTVLLLLLLLLQSRELWRQTLALVLSAASAAVTWRRISSSRTWPWSAPGILCAI